MTYTFNIYVYRAVDCTLTVLNHDLYSKKHCVVFICSKQGTGRAADILAHAYESTNNTECECLRFVAICFMLIICNI